MKLPTWPQCSKINKINLRLHTISNILEKLNNPQDKLPPIFHIAGTNGKGSTSAFLKYILEENGYIVHRYTSPHLVRFNERIEISGKEITDEYYYELAKECKFIIEKYKLDISYFETITAIAFMAFSRNNADALILEVGLGGRLDATNIIKKSLCSIITPISFDHVNRLGNTLEKIAYEKISIAKDNCPVVIAKQEKEVIETIKNELSKKNNCKAYFYNNDYTFKQIDENNCQFIGFSKNIKTKLPNLVGNHQIINAGTAIASLLCQNELKITDESISNGISKTSWKGRLQNLENTKLYNLVPKNSELYLDGGHNEGGARVIKEWIEDKNKKDDRKNIIIISMLDRKDSKSYINVIKDCFSEFIVVSSNNYSSNHDKYKSIEDFKKEFEEVGIKVFYSSDNVVDALKATNNIKSNKKLRILICGSLFFCGDVLSLIENY